MEQNNKNKYIIAGVVVVVLALIAIPLIKKFSSKPVADNVDNTVVSKSGEETFSGTISAVDTGCFVDAVCSVTISGKKVILAKGGLLMPTDIPVGRLIGVNSIGELEDRMGAFANVYAGLTPEGDYTLYGNTEYFVEVVKTSGK